MAKISRLWIMGFLAVALAQIAYAGCCVDPNIQGGQLYCKGDAELVGPEQCCNGAPSCTAYREGVLCSDITQCESISVGCCCTPTVGIPMEKVSCESPGWVFNGSITNPTVCENFCKTISPLAGCASQNWKLSLSPIKGKKEIQIAVSGCNPMGSYDIKRYDSDGISNKTDIVLSTQSTETFYDRNVEWGKTYRYKVFVAGTDNVIMQNTTSPGDFECMGQFGSEKFCLPSYYYLRKTEFLEYLPEPYTSSVNNRADNYYSGRFNNAPAYCNDKNLLTSAGPSCGGSACVIDKATNNPLCLSVAECSGDSSNVFGMLFSNNTCELTNGNRNYCFYDRSETTADYCYSCRPEMSCADYKSEYSCRKDNCGLNRCSWNTTNAAMSTGVCIDSGSSSNCPYCDNPGTETMQNRNAFNKIFDVCNKRKTDALSTSFGFCIYLPKTASSLSCLDTTCTDYDSDSCQSFSSVTLDRYNILSSKSDDPCSIGVCRFFSGGNGCRKDADYSLTAAPDCPKEDASCEKDYFKPYAEIKPANYYKGCPINFTINIFDQTDSRGYSRPITNDQKYRTFFCTGAGCLSNPETFSAMTNRTRIKVNGLNMTDDANKPLLTLVENDNTVYFYTKDPASNIGVKRNITFIASENCAYIDYQINIR